ncbi:MAG: DUF3540 domain-containing protein [Desulfobacteraceae bacterium]|nr:DUF3540 domain-containing protein [Desulfobacteraceae bacterium]MBC2754351.1 DUF3540 domain-containing protein [Desulfobacteraceae bacterium]
MQNIAKIYENQSSDKFFGTARIVRTEENQGLVKVAFAENQIRKEVMARPAISLPQKFSTDDEVLVIEDNNGNFYVIGVMDHQNPQSDPVPQMILSDGTFASLNNSEKGQTLCVYSNNNALLFEYNPDTKKARIFSNAENVVFDAPKGNIELNAAGNIRLKGQQVELTGRSGVGLSVVGQMFEKLKSDLSLKPGKIDITSQELRVSARRTSVFLEEARNNIKAVVSRIESVKLVAGKLETTASSIIEKAINTYRTTENLNQVKAGRMRMLIHKTFHLKSKSSIIKAEDDVKIKGEKIHLG